MSIQPWHLYVHNYHLMRLGQKIERLGTLMRFGFFDSRSQIEREQAQLILEAGSELQQYVRSGTLPVENEAQVNSEMDRIVGRLQILDDEAFTYLADEQYGDVLVDALMQLPQAELARRRRT